jgi:hypothetical protein
MHPFPAKDLINRDGISAASEYGRSRRRHSVIVQEHSEGHPWRIRRA